MKDTRINQGKFVITLISPGLRRETPGDRGPGPPCRVDHATIEPGGFIPMHPHQNDEILSYMRRGTLLHKDSHGLSEALHGTHMMMMNAGSRLRHEEGVDKDDLQRVNMLQIFFRPYQDDVNDHLHRRWSFTGVELYWDLPRETSGRATRTGLWKCIPGNWIWMTC